MASRQKDRPPARRKRRTGASVARDLECEPFIIDWGGSDSRYLRKGPPARGRHGSLASLLAMAAVVSSRVRQPSRLCCLHAQTTPAVRGEVRRGPERRTRGRDAQLYVPPGGIVGIQSVGVALDQLHLLGGRLYGVGREQAAGAGPDAVQVVRGVGEDGEMSREEVHLDAASHSVRGRAPRQVYGVRPGRGEGRVKFDARRQLVGTGDALSGRAQSDGFSEGRDLGRRHSGTVRRGADEVELVGRAHGRREGEGDVVDKGARKAWGERASDID
mmetsp:Transcript_9667/g.18309  ORF Transcript_9667/g.18309 Transcript_9667/m.18309 type:complete len:273 (-) Transcript_9667:70-888(-)